MPPPPQLAICHADVEQAVNSESMMSKRKRTSGYALWSKNHKDLIKSRMAPGATGIRAYGAAAGQLWRDLNPQLKMHYNELARNQDTTTAESPVGPLIASAASVMPPSSSVSALVESVAAPTRSDDTASACPVRSDTPTPVQRTSPLDLSEDEDAPEPGEEGVQPTPPQAAPHYSEEPPPRFSRLEALRARVLNRIRAQSAGNNG